MEEAHIVVDVDLAHLSESMSLELDKLAGKPNEKEIDEFTIFPVPYKFRQSKKNLFDPSVVSIGPLHHGKESLKAMEDQKWQCLRDFLCRGDHISLDLCLSEIKKLEEKTRRCYRESVPLDSNSFVQMMLLDGCFVLEQFLKGNPYTTNESKTILANIIAFEQYKSDKTSAKLSSFALFLDSLVNTTEDVMILQQCGIINNCLNSDEELIDFFNQICKGMVVDNNHFLAELFAKVNNYCKSSWSKRLERWNRHKKQFIKDYFSSPWTAISLVAGVFVVLLTFVQAFFAVYAYYVPPS
ncbi:uncharacterized protein LOC144549329 [Carex rostrata]